MLLKLLLGKAALLRQALAAFGQFGQADHLGLVGFQEAAIGTVHPVQSCAHLLAGRFLTDLRNVSLSDEPFKLRRQLGRVAEQAGDVVPYRLLQRASINARARAPRVPSRRERVRASALVVAVA